METDQEKIDYDLDLIELEDCYNRIKKLYRRKDEMVNEFYSESDQILSVEFRTLSKIIVQAVLNNIFGAW